MFTKPQWFLVQKWQTLYNSKIKTAAKVGYMMVYNMNCLVIFVLKYLCKELKSLDQEMGV